MSTRTKVLGGLALLMFLLFAAFETDPGQRILVEHWLLPLVSEDLLHGSALLPALLFLLPGIVLAIAAGWSKVAEGRHRHR